MAQAQVPEVKVEKKDDFLVVADKTSVNGALKFGIFQGVLGLLILGTTFPIFLDFESYNNIKNALDEGGSPFAKQFALPAYQILVFLLFFLSAGSSVCGYYYNKKGFVLASFLLSLVASAITLYISISVKKTLDLLFDKLQGNPVTDSTFGDGEISVLDFTAAIFNECCLSQYDSLNYNSEGFQGVIIDSANNPLDLNQRAVTECKATLEETCPFGGSTPMFPEIVSTVLGSLGTGSINDLMCHCFGNTERYNKFIEIFRRDDLCQKYRNIVIPDADSRLIPVVDQPWTNLVKGLGVVHPEISAELPIGEFHLVGKILPKDQTYNEPSEDTGFSCGVGYAKAVALYMFYYVDDKTKVMIAGSFAAAAGTGASILVLLFFWGTGGNQSVAYADTYADDYGYGTDNAAPVRKTSKDEVVTSKGIQVLEIVPKAEVAKERPSSKPKAKAKPKDEYDDDDVAV